MRARALAGMRASFVSGIVTIVIFRTDEKMTSSCCC
jgi:hypothetical protein